jgi:hypothetical protein
MGINIFIGWCKGTVRARRRWWGTTNNSCAEIQKRRRKPKTEAKVGKI